jgi:hypothetical protein
VYTVSDPILGVSVNSLKVITLGGPTGTPYIYIGGSIDLVISLSPFVNVCQINPTGGFYNCRATNGASYITTSPVNINAF